SSVGQRIQIQVRNDGGIDSYGAGRQDALPGVGGRNGADQGVALNLAEALIICEKEKLVFEYRAPSRPAGLVPAVSRQLSRIKKVRGVESFIAHKLMGAPMELITSGTSYRADDAACVSAIFGTEAVRKNAKLQNPLHAERLARRPAMAVLRGVIHHR